MVDRYNKHENTNYSIFTTFSGDRGQWIVTGSEDNKVRGKTIMLVVPYIYIYIYIYVLEAMKLG